MAECEVCCCCISSTATLIVLIVFLAGGNPRLRLSSVSLETLKHTSNSSEDHSLILIFNAEFKVKNKNLIDAKMRSTKATISFAGAEIGSSPINGLDVGKLSTEKFNMTVYVDSDKISASNETDNLRREMLSSRNLTLVAFAKFKTEVNWIFKKSSKMNCTFVVDTVSKKIVPLKCK